MGLTIWSPLASGVLTGKYNEEIPQNSRLASEAWLIPEDMQVRIDIVKKLTKIADKVGCSMTQLALAWCLKNSHVSTVILGASRLEQLQHNLAALDYKEKLTAQVMTEIDQVLQEYKPRKSS